MIEVTLSRADLSDPQVVSLVQRHLLRARAATAPGSAHALDVGELRAPEISLWAAWEGGSLLGIAALKRLASDHGEVKSMYTAENVRRRGVARALLQHIVAEARSSGLARLSLETGSWDYFEPARALYRSLGFSACGPFASYKPDPHSMFMTLDLRIRE